VGRRRSKPLGGFDKLVVAQVRYGTAALLTNEEKMKNVLLLLLIIPLLLACPKRDTMEKGGQGRAATTPSSALPNPAAALIQKESELYKKAHGIGFKYEIKTTEAGQAGVVIFPDSSECDEWEFYQGLCGQKWSACAQAGYDLISVTDTSSGFGSVYSVCVFPSGTRCRETDFVSGKCEVEK
jgi:putative hemolysin